MTVRVFVDTNILIYALDPREPEKRRTSADLLRETIRRRTLTLSPQSLNEGYRVLTQRTRLMPKEAARQYIGTLAPWATAPLDSRVTERAFKVEDDVGASWWDSLMLASALTANCKIFVTEDLQHDRTIGSMRIMNPFTEAFARVFNAS